VTLPTRSLSDSPLRRHSKPLTEQIAPRGVTAPALPDPPPFHADSPRDLDFAGFGVVIFTSGFRPDHARWVRLPAFDAMGFPLTDNGSSTVVQGLFLCGAHFMRRRKSSVQFGVSADAAVIAQSIARHPSATTAHKPFEFPPR
jgi:putative flavoprotein involved in K+ transport